MKDKALIPALLCLFALGAGWQLGRLCNWCESHGSAARGTPVVRFPPGLYQLETTEPGDGPSYWIEYDVEWQARLLTR